MQLLWSISFDGGGAGLRDFTIRSNWWSNSALEVVVRLGWNADALNCPLDKVEEGPSGALGAEAKGVGVGSTGGVSMGGLRIVG